MNPKVIGILMLVVGLGVGLYLINSGGAAKFGSLFTPPGESASSSTSASTTISNPAMGFEQSSSQSSAPSSSSSTSGFSWTTFFSSIFGAPHGFANIPTVSSVNGGSGSNYGGSGSGNTAGVSGSSNSSNSSGGITPPAGLTVSQLSPYYQKVHLSGVSQGEITVSTYPAYGTPTSTVDITGWEIKTNRGGEFIPQAANLYYPVGQSPESDIILALNEPQYVNMYSNSAPQNLRINACMGYLNATHQFNPGFSYDCPAVDHSQLSQFTGACQNYIMSLYDCQSPDFTNYYFPRNDYQCEDYLTGKYNYNWCVSTYASSPNFFGNEWRIWMGATPLDPYHDNVELLDKNGLVVDIYHY
jgi:hypothetical protein